uniref:Rad50/SbcC-type AAA domain-containing protein n=1 Tax=Romanomermis culicivorax TaxID=13658 RepID=A0A915IM67_ROMCU
MSVPSKKFKKTYSPQSSGDDEVIPGIIEVIHLKNFMCHSNLRFEFGPHLNFITGQNGSGKSAVLAAVVIGLGAKASSMSRYASAKEYIKNDCNAAEISVILSNAGSDAFEPETFGRKIVVERKISKAGGGSYKMKSESGNVVYEKRDHLTRMLQHFNIQLENPVTMLTQDVSRQFLQSMKPNRLYDVCLVVNLLPLTV